MENSHGSFDEELSWCTQAKCDLQLAAGQLCSAVDFFYYHEFVREFDASGLHNPDASFMCEPFEEHNG